MIVWAMNQLEITKNRSDTLIFFINNSESDSVINSNN